MKQRRGVNRYNTLTRRKKEEKASLHMHDTVKTYCEIKNEIKNNKKQTENVLPGSNPHPRK